MSDKSNYDIIQEQLQRQNPFNNLDLSIFRSLEMLDKLEDENEKDYTKKYFMRNQHKIIPDSELKFIDTIMKIKEVRNLLVIFKKLEYDYMEELDEQLKDVVKPELKKELLQLIENELN
jgi:hypothetical protein